MNRRALDSMPKPARVISHLGLVKRIWYLSPLRAAKVQASLRIRAVSPEPPPLAHTSSESRGTFRQKASSLAPLNGWTCAVKICHDGMLEETQIRLTRHINLTCLDLSRAFCIALVIKNIPELCKEKSEYPRYSLAHSGSWLQLTDTSVGPSKLSWWMTSTCTTIDFFIKSNKTAHYIYSWEQDRMVTRLTCMNKGVHVRHKSSIGAIIVNMFLRILPQQGLTIFHSQYSISIWE